MPGPRVQPCTLTVGHGVAAIGHAHGAGDRDARAELEVGALAPQAVLREMPAVIAQQHDDSVVRRAQGANLIQQHPHQLICGAYRSEVVAAQLFAVGN